MNRTFKQLTAEQRYQIATLLSKQFSQKQIARYIGKSESCVSREISRNKMYSGKYDAANAHQYAVCKYPQYLARKQRSRKKRGNKTAYRGQIANKVSI